MSTQYEKEMIRMMDRIVKNLETLNQTLKMRTNMEVGLISEKDILSKIPFAKTDEEEATEQENWVTVKINGEEVKVPKGPNEERDKE